MLHSLLKRQLKKCGITDVAAPPSAESFATLLERVSRSYTESDEERYTLERSLGLSSEEMQELHRKVEKQNRILHQVLTRYVAEEVATDILSNPDEKLKLGGETRLLTVLFADIRNYTSFSKSKDAQLIIQILNKIFEHLVPIIFEEHGTLDKFMGDAVMAFYGAPVSYDDDALRAVRTAVKMQNAIRSLREEDTSLSEIAFGAGVFTGYAVVGNLGSLRLMNYTCIGDTANSAKRLQESAKADQILIDSATYEAVLDSIEAQPTEPLLLKGKKTATIAYEVLSMK
jgi:class 3 adenylate cyclase